MGPINLDRIADSRMLLSSTVDYPIVVRYLLHLHCRNVQIAVCPSSQCPSRPSKIPTNPAFPLACFSSLRRLVLSPLHIFGLCWAARGTRVASHRITSHHIAPAVCLFLLPRVEELIARGIYNDDDYDDDRRRPTS